MKTRAQNTPPTKALGGAALLALFVGCGLADEGTAMEELGTSTEAATVSQIVGKYSGYLETWPSQMSLRPAASVRTCEADFEVVDGAREVWSNCHVTSVSGGETLVRGAWRRGSWRTTAFGLDTSILGSFGDSPAFGAGLLWVDGPVRTIYQYLRPANYSPWRMIMGGPARYIALKKR